MNKPPASSSFSSSSRELVDPEIAELLARRWSGQASEADEHEIARWMAQDTARRDVVSLLQRSWNASDATDDWAQTVDVQDRVLLAIQSGQARGQVYGQRRERTYAWRRTVWYAVAGVALGSVALVAAWRVRRAHRDLSKGQAVSTYITQNGQRANIVLTDGTVAALDVASRLDVPADYPSGDHTLRLTGEAMFTVAHHNGSPFTVITGNTTTRVLGTSFLVRHYATDTSTTVAVRDGKVAVLSDGEHAERQVVLTAARQAEIDQLGLARVGDVDASQFSFVQGVLTYPGGTLQDAIPVLDRWYDADIRLGDPVLAKQWLTGDFAVGTLADISRHLAVTFNVRVERVGRVLTLYPR